MKQNYSQHSKSMLKDAIIGIGACLIVVGSLYLAGKLVQYVDQRQRVQTYTETGSNDAQTTRTQNSSNLSILLGD